MHASTGEVLRQRGHVEEFFTLREKKKGSSLRGVRKSILSGLAPLPKATSRKSFQQGKRESLSQENAL